MSLATDLVNAAKSSYSSSASSTSSTAATKKSLSATDFINIMITQLQNQDPTEPTKSSDLLSQMSQIGSLQASTDLQTSLKTMSTQNGISNAAAMIGKKVTGKDTDGSDMNGIVTSVKISDGNLSLELDSGKSMAMSNVLTVSPVNDTAAVTTPATTKAA